MTKKTQETFTIDPQTKLDKVALKVANLAKLSQFYHEVIGLEILASTATKSHFGVAGKTLLTLEKLPAPLASTPKTGLFHLAFLLPTRQNLGEALAHYLQVEAPLTGASDHGYSEAVYLTDPEGNGIEVYWDKPREDWTITDTGKIPGVTEEMDVKGVLGSAKNPWQGFSEGTVLGHVHLKVNNLDKTAAFYELGLGLTLTSDYGKQAKFFAAGNYHHHLGANTWQGRLPLMTKNDLGVAYFSFLVSHQEALDQLAENLQAQEIFHQKSKGKIWLQDPNGIPIEILTIE